MQENVPNVKKILSAVPIQTADITPFLLVRLNYTKFLMVYNFADKKRATTFGKVKVAGADLD